MRDLLKSWILLRSDHVSESELGGNRSILLQRVCTGNALEFETGFEICNHSSPELRVRSA